MAKGICSRIFVLILAACGSAAEEPAEVEPGTEEEKESELTLSEVFNKAQEVSENVNSSHTKMDITQAYSSQDSEEEFESTIQLEMDLIQEPLAMYQEMSMSMGDFGAMDTEVYYTDEGFFLKNPEEDNWMKLPSDDLDDLQELINTGPDAAIDYASLEKYIEDFSFEQNDEQYILNLKVSGDGFSDLVREELASTGMMDAMGDEVMEELEDMKVHQLEYEIFIDKDTFETTDFNLVLDMEFSVGEETLRIKQDAEAEISQVNEITEISIPEEVVENAVQY